MAPDIRWPSAGIRVSPTYRGHGSMIWVAELIAFASPAPRLTPSLRWRYSAKGSSQGANRQQITRACAAKAVVRKLVFIVMTESPSRNGVNRAAVDFDNVAVRAGNVAAGNQILGQFLSFELSHQEDNGVVPRKSGGKWGC